MTRRLVCIVEGHGEVDAVPILVRRIVELEGGLVFPELARKYVLRFPRSKLLKKGELERAIEYAARLAGPDGSILVVVDADDALPCELGPTLLGRASAARPDMRLGVVVASREFEGWFLAAAASLAGVAGLPPNLEPPPAPESIRDAKGWLKARRGGNYAPTKDQAKLAAAMSLDEARRAPSFDKFWREIARLLAP